MSLKPPQLPARSPHADSAQILAALEMRPRPGLYVDAGQDETGHLVIIEAAANPEEGDAIIGLAIRGPDGWYLGCIQCSGEIAEADSGMCQPCREDAEWQEQQRSADGRGEDW